MQHPRTWRPGLANLHLGFPAFPASPTYQLTARPWGPNIIPGLDLHIEVGLCLIPYRLCTPGTVGLLYTTAMHLQAATVRKLALRNTKKTAGALANPPA